MALRAILLLQRDRHGTCE